MKTHVIVTFQIDAEASDRVAHVLADQVAGRTFDPGTYEVRFARGEGGFHELLALLGELTVPYVVTEERSFRKDELEQAAALHLSPAHRAPPADADADPDDEAEELLLDDAIDGMVGLTVTARGEFIVNERVARELIHFRMSGCLLRGIRDTSGRVRSLFQVMPVHTLPPVQSPPTRFCASAQSGGFSLASMLYYDAPVQEFCDMNASAERFGQGPHAWQEIVISQRLFRLLLEHGTVGAQVEPVVLV